MGRGKREDAAAAAAEDAPDIGGPQPADMAVCVFCEVAIEEGDGLEVECSRCGPWRTHVECGCDYLHKHIRASNNNSAAQNKYKVLVRKRPTYFYSSEGVPCPRRGDGGKQGGGGGAHAAAAGSKGSKGGKGKGAVVTSTSCPGICIGAEMSKPAKQAAAPAQPAAPPAPAAAPARPQLPTLAGVRRKKGRCASMAMGLPPMTSRPTPAPHADLLTKWPDPLRGDGGQGGGREIPGLAPDASSKARKAKAAKAAAAGAAEAAEAAPSQSESALVSVSEACGGGGGAGQEDPDMAVFACVSALLDMGFEWEAATEAAEVAGGDLEAATQLLLGGAVGGASSAGSGGGGGGEAYFEAAAYAQHQEAVEQPGWGAAAGLALPSWLPAAASWANGASEASPQGTPAARHPPQPSTPLHGTQQYAAPSPSLFATPVGDSAFDAGFAAGLAAAGLSVDPLQHKWAAPAQPWAASPPAPPAAAAEEPEIDELLSLMGIT